MGFIKDMVAQLIINYMHFHAGAWERE